MARFDLLVELAAAVDRRRDDDIPRLAAALATEAGAEAVRELLRQVHLFRGFPRVVHAFNLVDPELQRDAEPPAAEPAPCGVEGELLFRRLYGDDAERVLPHLRRLDPVFASWVLDHAYGRVMRRQLLPLAERERLAVLLLAADGCWRQWLSHVRICRRLGVPLDDLIGDLERADWLHDEQRQRARQTLGSMSGDDAEARGEL